MKNVNQIIEIEKYNEEFLALYHSKSARRKRNFIKLRNSSFRDISRLTKKKILAKTGDIKIKLNTIPRKDQPLYCNFGKPLDNVKVAVYTCITNGYDSPKTPLYLGNDTQYFLFTDSIEDNDEKIWKKQNIDCKIPIGEANRFYKFHPDVFKDEFDFAIYVDGNVKVISDVTTLCSIARNSTIGIAMHRHHARDCVYEEGKACKYYKRGNIKVIENNLKKMESEGFPSHFGLCEATVIVYDLKNPIAKKISHEWWNMYNESKAKRDQIFFPYVLWKMGYRIEDVGNLGNDIWKNPKFILYGHD